MPVGKLSIIVPVYNECETVVPVLKLLEALQLPGTTQKEILVVDDASTDNSTAVIKDYFRQSNFPFILIQHSENKGKGGSIITGLGALTGDYFIIQDADLELNPEDIITMVSAVNSNRADVVYGSRFLNGSPAPFSLSKLANTFLTWFSNFSFGTRLTDMETCYKLIPVSAMDNILLKEQRFGFEPEITAKLARNKSLRFFEVPIRYSARTSLEGKKIGWKDGFRAVWCIVKYGWLGK
ncbi:MAG TPA: glycosyltransferase family 2 protein [Bacteroidia bacterium]|nr:glycosyltransferase family 2 protein [Bacteroidia bacterium]